MQTLNRTTGASTALDGNKLNGHRVQSAKDIGSSTQMIQAVIDLESRYGSITKTPSDNPELIAVQTYNHSLHREPVSLKRQKIQEGWSKTDEVIIREYMNNTPLVDIGLMVHMGRTKLYAQLDRLYQEHKIPVGRRQQMYEVNYKGRILTGSMRQLTRRLSVAEVTIRAYPLKKLKKAAFESD